MEQYYKGCSVKDLVKQVLVKKNLDQKQYWVKEMLVLFNANSQAHQIVKTPAPTTTQPNVNIGLGLTWLSLYTTPNHQPPLETLLQIIILGHEILYA